MIAPVNSQQNAENVRNATLTLADYALSESSIYSGSPSQGSIHQANIDSYFPHDESESGFSRTPYDPQDDVIVEVSEPTSPAIQAVSPGRISNLTELIKRSPPSTNPSSPPNHSNSAQIHMRPKRVPLEEEIPHFVITGREVGGEAHEETPLLKTDHPNGWSEIFRNGKGRKGDVESQRQPRVSSWRKVSKHIQQRLEQGRNACRTLANPKSWDARAIWDTAVITPAACLPAVLLGLLLNILDALSYGMTPVHFLVTLMLKRPRYDSLPARSTRIRETWSSWYLHVLREHYHIATCLLLWCQCFQGWCRVRNGTFIFTILLLSTLRIYSTCSYSVD